MIYKRAFGKKGLVAALVYEPDLRSHDVMTRLEGACIQCGVLEEYAIDVFKTTTNPELSDDGIDDMLVHAGEILTQDYRAVVTVGEYAYRTMELAMDQYGKHIMHIGVSTETLEENDTFRVSRIDPIFEKNISAEDRLYVIDRLSPEQAERRKAQQRKALREKVSRESGFMGVVGPNGRPTVIRVDGADPFDETASHDDEVFEA